MKFIIKLSCLFIVLLSGNLFSQNRTNNVKDTVFIGYSTHVFQETNLEDAKAATSILIQKMIGEWRKNDYATVKLYDQASAIEDDYSNKKLDLLALTSNEYLTLKKRLNLTPLVAYVFDGESQDNILLIVNKSSNVESISDLRNKKILIYKPFRDNYSITETWFKTLVLEAKEDYSKFFADNISENYKVSQCVYDLFFKKTDAIVVTKKLYNSLLLLNPQLEKQLKIIKKSGSILYSLLCYTERIKGHKDFTLDELVQKLCDMSKSSTGRQFLNIFRVDGFIPFRNEYLKNTEDLYNEYNKLENSTKQISKKH